jgi:hypothetical protein
MHRTPRLAVRTAAAPPLIAAAIALALAGCGSSGKPKSSSRSAHANQFLAFSQCMRAHGVTNFPDPSSSGGIQIGNGSGINPSAPSFRAAQAACFHLLPGGGPGRGKPSAAAMHQMVAMSACMRAHGVTGFPDPTESSGGPPNLNPADYSLVEDRGGVVLAVPKSIDPNSPVFQRASAACGFGGGPGSGHAKTHGL